MIERSPQQDARIIKNLAWRYARHLGRSRDLADVEQEFWIEWTKAREFFDPDCGVSFEAYLTKLCKRRVSNLLKSDYSLKRSGFNVSMFDRLGSSEDSETIEDRLQGDYEDPVDRIARLERAKGVLSVMSKPLRQVVEILTSDHPLVMREVEAARAKADFAKTLGIVLGRPSDVTVGMTDVILGVSRNTRNSRLNEHQKAIKQKRL